jgi:hypothetical protein
MLINKYHKFIFLKVVFFNMKNSINRRGTKVCAHSLDFQYNNFLYVFLIVKKQPLYVNFSISPSRKKKILNVPHLLWV